MSKTLIWIAKLLVTVIVAVIVDKILTFVWNKLKNIRSKKNKVQEGSAV